MYGLIWSVTADNFGAAVLFITFLLMGLFGFLGPLFIGRFNIFLSEPNFVTSSMWYVIFFAGYYAILSMQGFIPGLSIFQVSQQHMLSSVAAQMPIVGGWAVTNIFAPIAEDVFWLLFITTFLMAIFFDPKHLKVNTKQEKIIAFFIIVVIAAASFALFHVGMVAATGFLIVAFIFRMIGMYMYWGDRLFNTIPALTVLVSSVIALHQSNNIYSTGGIIKAVSLLVTSPIGYPILIVYGIIFIAGVYGIYNKFGGGD